MNQTNAPVGIFLIGGPGSGKDYVLNNIFSRFDLTEIQVEHLLNGSAKDLVESNRNIVINGALDADKISAVEAILEGYNLDYVYVSVTNKVSRDRNARRANPLVENKRLEKWYRADKLAKAFESAFVFNNSINLNESGEMEKVFFAAQIEKILSRLTTNGLALQEAPKLPEKYTTGLTSKEIAAKKRHITRNSKLSDRDPDAYKDMPGDKRVRKEGMPLSKYTKKYREKFGEEVSIDESSDKGLSAKAEKSGVSVGTLKKVYRRGVAAWNSGHRPGTTPQQWGMARVNSYIAKGKGTYHGADKDLREQEVANEGIMDIFRKETQIERFRRLKGLPKEGKPKPKTTEFGVGDEKRSNEYYANQQMAGMKEETKITGTNCANCLWLKKGSEKPVDKSELNSNGGLKPTSEAYIDMAKHVDLVSLPGKATVKTKAFCNHEDVQDFVTERMCCAYWDNKDAKRDFKGKADVMDEETDINKLFEMQLMGTDEYRKHAISMTPGQTQEIQNAYKTMEPTDGKEECSCGGKCNGDCGCGGTCGGECTDRIREGSEPSVRRRFSSIRASIKEAKKESSVEEDTNEIDLTPTLKKRKNPKTVTPGKAVRTHIDGLPVTARLYGEEVSLEEAVQYHLDNKVSFTENVFRPGSDMFFQMIGEAKRLFEEGKYTPADGYEQDLLESDIGQTGIYEGEEVLLDFPFLEELNEDIKDQYKELMKLSIKELRDKIKQSSRVVDVSGFKTKDHAVSHILRQQHGHKKVAAAFGLNEEDDTGGKGIGKPFRTGGGGAVYVKNAKGNVIKVNFSQSGMKKRINEPGRVRSFVARHHCLTNKDKTSASYWACRWPRYFSNTGQQWW
jgi:dephospho-CoA kinase